MSEPVTKQRPTVDLDDFERELRDGYYHPDDPLAELARLVGEQPDPYGDVFAREAKAPVQPAYATPAPAHVDDRRENSRREPAFDTSQASRSPRLSGDFAAIEAGLRGAGATNAHYDQHHAAEPTFDGGFDHRQDYGQDHAHDYDSAGYAEPTAYDPAWSEPPRATRSARRPMLLLGATIAVAVVGIGGAFALKGHVGRSPREVKTILADESPTKVQPPAEAADTQTSQDAAVMGKGQSSPTALVNHEEQPVDLLQAARENAAAQARRTDASSVPVPPSPGQVQTAMADPSSSGAQNFSIGDMPAPKRVRVVSVRPDGTILPNDKPPQAAMPAPRAPAGKTSDRAGAVAKPSTPKAVASKTTSRVTAPKSIDQLADAPDDATPAPVAKVKKPKPQRVASADTGEAEATQAASPEPEAGGGFAVQLAAPGSEADAKSTSSRLSKKFAGPLAGHHLGFHKAESNGRSVFRVRVSSLSRSEAVSLCDKLKADGGSCFVAKN